MGAIRTPDDRQPPRQEREEAARTWLGGVAGGGERLARIFQIGRTVRVAQLEAELAELRTKLDTVEDELRALQQDPNRPDVHSDAHSNPATDPLVIDLPRSLQPRERDYRLAHCEGFAVLAGERQLGVVEGVRYRSRTDRPDLLEVRSGRLGRRLMLVPVSEIEAIEPDDETVNINEALSPPRRREGVLALAERLFGQHKQH